MLAISLFGPGDRSLPHESDQSHGSGEQDEGPTPQFPPPRDTHGLVMLGGRLSRRWVLAAYRQGVFPWPIVEDGVEYLTWFSPDPRAILPLDALHVSRRLRRRLRRGEFQLQVNRRFEQVVDRCARHDEDDGVWLTQSMKSMYRDLHSLGHCHTVECLVDEKLVGGVLGVSYGGLFSAETMFHERRDAGNAALAFLVQRLTERGFVLLDIQQSSPHMTRLGAIEISRRDYLRRLSAALELETEFDSSSDGE